MIDKKVVIVGAGFAGIRVALDLSKACFSQITIISEHPFQTFNSDLYRLIGPKTLRQGAVDIPLSLIFARTKVNVIYDRFVAVDPLKNQVRTQDQKSIDYDFLVLAIGCKTSYLGIPGAEKYSHPLKNTQEALQIKKDLLKLTQSDTQTKIVVAGGGFSGVEIAASLADLPGVRITVLEAMDNLLTGMPAWSQQEAEKRLKILGVEVLKGAPIMVVADKSIRLKGEKEVNYDYLIWTTGIKGQMIPGLDRSDFNHKEQLLVTGYLNLTKYPNIFVAGDISANPPPAAWNAIAQAKVIAKNITKSIQGKRLITYVCTEPGFVVALGEDYAISNVFNLKIRGFLAAFLKKLIKLNYLLSILPFFEGLNFWRKGVKLSNTNE